MVIRRAFFSGVIKLPFRSGGRGDGICTGIGNARSTYWTLIWLGGGRRFQRRWGIARRSRGCTHLSVQLIAPHHVAKREKHSGEQQHQKKKTDDVPPFQNAFPRAGFPAEIG